MCSFESCQFSVFLSYVAVDRVTSATLGDAREVRLIFFMQ